MYAFNFEFTESSKDDVAFVVKSGLRVGLGDEQFRFTLNIEDYDHLVQWLFENTKGRFVFLGTNRIYFENEEDALAFKLNWL